MFLWHPGFEHEIEYKGTSLPPQILQVNFICNDSRVDTVFGKGLGICFLNCFFVKNVNAIDVIFPLHHIIQIQLYKGIDGSARKPALVQGTDYMVEKTYHKAAYLMPH